MICADRRCGVVVGAGSSFAGEERLANLRDDRMAPKRAGAYDELAAEDPASLPLFFFFFPDYQSDQGQKETGAKKL